MQLELADLLFVRNQHQAMDESISQSTGMGEYVHVAILIDDDCVIDATPANGVAITSLKEFIDGNKCIDVYRPMISDVEKVIAQAKCFEGEPYNASFYPDGEGKYCSQLVEVAFNDVLAFKSVAMQFGDGKKLVSDYWESYYAELEMLVPINQPGSNPNNISQSADLIYLGKL